MTAIVLGVGMAPFSTPRAGATYLDLGQVAARAALADAGVDYATVQQVYAGYVYGDSACGQRVVYGLGMTGVPVFNVTNYCATGSSALFLARQAVESGAVDCVLAVGFEQMSPGALTSKFEDRPSPIEPFRDAMVAQQGWREGAPRAAQFFGGAAREHQVRYGTKAETFAKVAVKARRHAAANPLAVFRDPLTLEEILGSPEVFEPLTRLQCCPPTSGAAAAVICTEVFAARRGRGGVRIRAQAMTTDRPDSSSRPTV
jgi:acetyl-CoA acetyltransferase